MARLLITATKRTSKCSAVSLFESLGYMNTEKRADEFLKGHSFLAVVDDCDIDIHTKNWTSENRVKVTPIRVGLIDDHCEGSDLARWFLHRDGTYTVQYTRNGLWVLNRSGIPTYREAEGLFQQLCDTINAAH